MATNFFWYNIELILFFFFSREIRYRTFISFFNASNYPRSHATIVPFLCWFCFSFFLARIYFVASYFQSITWLVYSNLTLKNLGKRDGEKRKKNGEKEILSGFFENISDELFSFIGYSIDGFIGGILMLQKIWPNDSLINDNRSIIGDW